MNELKYKSKLGWIFFLAFIGVSVYLFVSQGLFGESFIALRLGMPWSYIVAYFELYRQAGLLISLFVPIVLNALILYFMGMLIEQLVRNIIIICKK